ncbi:MAG: PTS sugar transporter subunit IIA [candidate division WOR-3 bacterium]|nr:PTS sugar transporter subunit IIA [candidate division WOR-3 bacterium]
MFLSELMDKRLINCGITAKDKKGVIEEMADMFVEAGVVTDKSDFCDSILKREEIESTAIGDGIAIPHGRSDAVKHLKLAFGRSQKGVNFEASDKKLVNIIFMIAAPSDARKEYLQAVAKIARLLKSRIMREALLLSETPKDVMKIIKDFDNMLVEEIKVVTKEGRVIHKD